LVTKTKKHSKASRETAFAVRMMVKMTAPDASTALSLRDIFPRDMPLVALMYFYRIYVLLQG
jgi:hypothetical protein